MSTLWEIDFGRSVPVVRIAGPELSIGILAPAPKRHVRFGNRAGVDHPRCYGDEIPASRHHRGAMRLVANTAATNVAMSYLSRVVLSPGIDIATRCKCY